MTACVERLPAQRRKLVTSHGALGYYADRYGMTVLGTVIPSLSTAAQPSSREIAELARRVEAEGVLAVFPEQSINPKPALPSTAVVNVCGWLRLKTTRVRSPAGARPDTANCACW